MCCITGIIFIVFLPIKPVIYILGAMNPEEIV
jgi:hypothetical protein